MSAAFSDVFSGDVLAGGLSGPRAPRAAGAVAGSTDWLLVHVTAQLVFLGVIALHVGLVLKHTVVRRHRHLGRML